MTEISSIIFFDYWAISLIPFTNYCCWVICSCFKLIISLPLLD